MNNKKRTSLKTLILLPVFILGALTIICNVMAINNIRTVNSNAADITDNCMMSVSDLGEIKNDIQVIHTLGLSHIIATDLNTMISVVGVFHVLKDNSRTHNNLPIQPAYL